MAALTLDLAVAEMVTLADVAVGTIGVPNGFGGDMLRGDEVVLYGAATRKPVRATVTAIEQTIGFAVTDANGNALQVTYKGQTLAEGATLLPGDSGAIVFNDLKVVVGMLVAEHQGKAVITPIRMILDRIEAQLGFRLIPARMEPDKVFPRDDAIVPLEDETIEIAWGKTVTELHGKAFKLKVIGIARNLGIDPSHMTAVMAFETGGSFDPKERNPLPGSTATGLIQFTSSTAKGLGTTVEKLAEMTGLEQLEFVAKHFAPHAGKMRKLSDVYMAVLLPIAVPMPESHVLFAKGSKQFNANSGLDINNDGQITKGEATSLIQAQLDIGMDAKNRG